MPHLQIVRSEEVSHSLNAPVRIGKDILGLLSTAMYTEPLAILREYVQNAADSIDLAYQAEILTPRKQGRIDVTVDREKRTLIVRDNGLGIARSSAEEVLVAFGLSNKRGTGARGFRGVGRLGGIGFAQEVVFRTQYLNETDGTEVIWDCRTLKSILVESKNSDLTDAVSRVVSVKTTPLSPRSSPFFEVELRGVARLPNDRLLNEEAIAKYLAQVAPLAFSPKFKQGKEISRFLRKHVQTRPIKIFVNEKGPITRPHQNTFFVAGDKRDRFTTVKCFTLDGFNGGVGAVGWILHHGYQGALKGSPEIRGLRARHGDIQIGDEHLFTALFPESRFSGWATGELHVLDPAVLPNARRDDFEPTPAYAHLLNRLGPIATELSQQCRNNSERRTRLNKFERLESLVTGIAKRIRNREVTGRRSDSARQEAHDYIREMEKLIPRCGGLGEQARLEARIHASRSVLGKSVEDGKARNAIDLLPKAKRIALEEFIEALVAASANKSAANQLAEKIVRRIVRRQSSLG